MFALSCANKNNHIVAIIDFSILLEQSFSAHMPLLTHMSMFYIGHCV